MYKLVRQRYIFFLKLRAFVLYLDKTFVRLGNVFGHLTKYFWRSLRMMLPDALQATTTPLKTFQRLLWGCDGNIRMPFSVCYGQDKVIGKFVFFSDAGNLSNQWNNNWARIL